MDMTPAQCAAARGWLGWSRDELAKEAKVGRNTVVRFEKGADLNDSTRFAITACFERQGFAFPDDNTVRFEARVPHSPRDRGANPRAGEG